LPPPPRTPRLPYTTLFRSPTLTLRPIPTLTLVLGWDFLWKHRKEDGVYAPPSPLTLIPETIGTGRYIGDQIKLEGRYRFDPRWEDRKSTRLNSSHVKISYA